MKILVVIDMQNDFITGVLGTSEAQAIVPAVADYIKNYDGEIYYTLDTHTENYLNTKEGKKLPIKHCIKGTEGHNLYKDIDEALQKKLFVYAVQKVDTFNGAFELDSQIPLHLESIDRIDIVGVCTDICVVSTVLTLKEMYDNADIIVHSSMCAGTTPEAHKAALTVMKSCQIEIED